MSNDNNTKWYEIEFKLWLHRVYCSPYEEAAAYTSFWRWAPAARNSRGQAVTALRRRIETPVSTATAKYIDRRPLLFPPYGHLSEMCRNPSLVYLSSRFLLVTRRGILTPSVRRLKPSVFPKTFPHPCY